MDALRTREGLGDRRRSLGIPRLGRRSIRHQTISTQYKHEHTWNMHASHISTPILHVMCKPSWDKSTYKSSENRNLNVICSMKGWVGGKLNKMLKDDVEESKRNDNVLISWQR